MSAILFYVSETTQYSFLSAREVFIYSTPWPIFNLLNSPTNDSNVDYYSLSNFKI